MEGNGERRILQVDLHLIHFFEDELNQGDIFLRLFAKKLSQQERTKRSIGVFHGIFCIKPPGPRVFFCVGEI